MYNKKEELLDLLNKGLLEGCCIVGRPTKELKEAYEKGIFLTTIMDKCNMPYEIGAFDDTSVSIYFPSFGQKSNTDLCYINIDYPLGEQIKIASESLLDEVYGYYQTKMIPRVFLKLIGMHPEEFTFSDLLLLLPEKNQSELARRIDKSRQTISDLKLGRTNLTIEVVAKLMYLYPLLPWDLIIKSLYKCVSEF